MHSDFAALDPLQKSSREFALTRVGFGVDGAKVEEFVAESALLLMLSADVSQSQSEIAKTLCFRPAFGIVIEWSEFEEEAFPSARALFQTS